MNIALVTIGDRGDLYRPQMLNSLAKFVPYKFDFEFHVDDSEHRLGMAGAINAAWAGLPVYIDWVFHVEEDFLFTAPVPIVAMVQLLLDQPRLAQVVLKRQPWSTEERAAGGIIEMHPDDYDDLPGYIEHRRLFSLNPCVYPASIMRDGWPEGNEAEFTARMLAEGRSFAFWGRRADPPMVEHIGQQRGQGWRL